MNTLSEISTKWFKNEYLDILDNKNEKWWNHFYISIQLTISVLYKKLDKIILYQFHDASYAHENISKRQECLESLGNEDKYMIMQTNEKDVNFGISMISLNRPKFKKDFGRCIDRYDWALQELKVSSEYKNLCLSRSHNIRTLVQVILGGGGLTLVHDGNPRVWEKVVWS